MEESTLEVLWSNRELVFLAFLGAFTLYVLNRLQNHQPFSLFKAINIDVGPNGRPLAILSDMFFSCLIGALLVSVLSSPDTGRQAIVAGLGMTGILSAASKG